MAKIYTAKELLKMSKAGQRAVVAELGMPKGFHKNVSVMDGAKRIMAFQAAQNVTVVDKAGPDERPENAAFEKLLTTDPPVVGDETVKAAGDVVPVEQESSGRGGVREGAGRPVGMTAEQVRVNRIQEKPNRVYLALCRLLFDLWAEKCDCDAVALTPEEAEKLALPWSQLGDYSGVNRYIPAIADIILCAGATTLGMLKVKSRIAQEHAAKVAAAPKPSGGADGTTAGQ
jgi:hypothetical protein